MGLTGALREVSVKKCPHCKKEYGRHSKKQFMKCLYTANYNLYHLLQEYNKTTAELEKMGGVIKETLDASELQVDEKEVEVVAEKVS